MIDLDELGKLREYLEDETVRHLIETERDRSAFDDPGCRCVLCVSRYGLLAMMQQVRRSVIAHATVAKLYGKVTAERDAAVAALDGAPEPETAPENYEPKCNGACVVHGSQVTNWPVQYGRRNRETGALHWLKGDPLDSWWDENQDRYEHVKRYTSPPLPAEGEKP